MENASLFRESGAEKSKRVVVFLFVEGVAQAAHHIGPGCPSFRVVLSEGTSLGYGVFGGSGTTFPEKIGIFHISSLDLSPNAS